MSNIKMVYVMYTIERNSIVYQKQWTDDLNVACVQIQEKLILDHSVFFNLLQYYQKETHCLA